MSWAWSQIHIAAAVEAASRGEFGLESVVPAKRQRLDTAETRQILRPRPSAATEEGAGKGPRRPSDDFSPGYSSQGFSGNASSLSTHHSSSTLLSNSSFEAIQEDSALSQDDHASTELFDPSLGDLGSPLDCGIEPFPSYVLPNLAEDSDPHEVTNLDFDFQISPQDLQNSFSSNQSLRVPTRYGEDHERPRRSRDFPPSARRQSNISALSPFSIDQVMISRTNNQSISNNLLQIYHDVFEHNLSCWLTEMTCPYKVTSTSPRSSDTSNEWGPSWSNRIYRRTLKLDQVAQSTQLIQTCRSENRAATKALHLCIMAFATQWAQGSHRQQERYSTLQSSSESLTDEMTEEFDRHLQRHFWDQAKRALDEVADVESYKVACAELIFGLAQKPWNKDDATCTASDESNFAGHRTSAGFDQASLMSEVASVISKDGPPMYLERAARKMHALKFRFDSLSRGQVRSGPGIKATSPLHAMGDEDRGTVGLLYWLAVMFDTVSSSMNERPVVVTDQDCQHDDQNAEDETEQNSRWKVDLFIQDRLESPYVATHWPCSYETAAEAVTKSAPVKVLLYRHLSYLQNVLRRGQHGQQVEDIIKSTMSLYRYWNMTHGAFFKELVQNFDSVPGRVQSWFVCISAHWHLAVLMLADLIEYVDQEGLGLGPESHKRLTSNMAVRIRESSAKELSDLARVATPSDEETEFIPSSQLPEFHHAVNEGTILTEPWTIILIRAFSKAAILLMGEADNCRQCGLVTPGLDGNDLVEYSKRAGDCIKSLWFLGKKSDMARNVAGVLSRALNVLRS